MSFLEPFPEDILSEIREYPGNQKCCDCGSLDTDWGSVSHGTLICLDCAGKHRSLGVHVSFVRSIRMDSWSRQQVEMMRQGGNQQIRRFFQKIEIENSPILTLYCTKGASHYRERLRERVDKIMSGEIKSEKRIVHNSPKPLILTSTSLKTNSSNEMHSQSSLSMSTRIENFRIMFADGPMGMTLTKDSKEMALVSKLIPGGAAQCNGVKIGDHIVGVAGKSLDNYDEIMHMIPCMNRPLEIQFSRIISIASKSAVAVDNRLAKVHESKSDSDLVISAALSPKQTAQLSVTRLSANDGIADIFSDNNLTKTSSTSLKAVSNEIYVQKSRKNMIAAESEDDEDEDEEDVDDGDENGENIDDNVTAQSIKNALTSFASISPSVPVPSVLSIEQPPKEVMSWSPGTNRSMSPLAGTFEVSPVSSPERMLSTHPACRTNLSVEGISSKATNNTVRFENAGGVDSVESMAVCDNLTKKATEIMLEAGAIVKVIRDGRWRSCVIRRKHKDGTFKVSFRDGSTESRVPTSRMALSKSALSFATTSAERSNVDAQEENNKPAISLQRSFSGIEEGADKTSFEYDAADFIVNSSVDIESWIEQDEDYSGGIYTGGLLKSKSHDPSDSTSRFQPSLRSVSYDPQSVSQLNAMNNAYTSLDDKNDYAGAVNGAGHEADIEVTFDEPPLGLTLSMGADGEPEVTKTVLNGAAMRMGIQLGDILVKVATSAVSDYDEVMKILPFCPYPLTLVFRRGKNKKESLFSGEAVLRNSTLIATKLMDSIGLNKPPTSLLHAPTATRLSNSKRNNAFDGGSLSPNASNNSSSNSGISSNTLSSRYLSSSVTSDKEFDATFDDVELGFRMDERMGVETVSVVTQVLPNSPAMEKGVRVGCILVGINYEKFISHAHSVATLKYVKRPVTVRFRRDTK